MPIQSINPTTGELTKTYQPFPESEICAIIEKNHDAFLEWKRVTLAKRIPRILTLAESLKANKTTYATLMAQEMGKPITQGLAEIDKCAWACEYYAENAEMFLKDHIIPTEASESYVTAQPLGPILAVMPWNFPFWQVLRAAVPALLAGNSILLKHSSNVPNCALTLEALFQSSGIPTHLFRTLLIGSDKVPLALSHTLVQAATLTGSTHAGSQLAAQAGLLLKKVVLELGGSDPYIILEDADLDLAAKACTTSRMLNAGQSCIAAKRFIVPEKILKPFEAKVLEQLKNYLPSNPLDEACNLGPMARHDLRDELHDQVQRSINAGAKLLLGGQIPDSPGAYYPPTLLTNVKAQNPAYNEELFGPVATIIPVTNEEEAIRVANDTPFGLGSAIFSKDIEKAKKLARTEIQAGSCFINDFVKSDPRLPFGGIKHSGYGRELGPSGLYEFINLKTIKCL